MRIAIVSRGKFPGYDGPARRVKYLGAGLAKNGCDVSLIVAYPPDPEPCSKEFENAYGYRYVHTIRREQTDATTLPTQMYYKLAGTVKVFAAVARMHKAKPVDAMLVCGVGFVELLVTSCIAWRFKVKLTVDKNDVNYRLKARSGRSLYGFLSGINMALSEGLLNRCADIIFTVNTYLHDLYSKTARGRVRYIIPSFVDCREIEEEKPTADLFDHFDGVKFLSVVTTPYHLYGFVPFATALSMLRAKFRFRVYLLCSRDQETLACVDQLLVKNDLKPLTKVLTRISPEIVQSVYAGADIILNSQQEPEIAEGGFPGKTAEILASRRPIVTTMFSDLHKYYVDGSNCLVVTYNDIASYIRAISALCESADLRERLGREGRKTALQAFEYVRGTKQIKAEISEALQAPSPA